MSFNDLAESLKVKPQEAAAAEPKYSFTQPAAAPEPEPAPVEKPAPAAKPKATDKGVDPAHWWGALTDQFQHIATHAMNDMAHRAQAHAHTGATPKAATSAKPPAAKKPAVKKSAARKTTAQKVPAKKTKRCN
jgi:hypothetical protein